MLMEKGLPEKEAETPGLVSVVLNFFNAAPFLREAIDSVFAQSYSTWELLLVDDGSTDAGTDIARSCAAVEPARVRYLHHPNHANKGTSASRNLGVINAHGEFIAFLDADDVWLPKRLEQGVELLRKNPAAGLVYGRSEYWFSWAGARATSTDRIQPHGFKADRVVPGRDLLTRFLTRTAAVPTPTSMTLRRQAVLVSGGFEEVFRGMHDDQVFLVRFCIHHDVYVAKTCWDRYRQHDSSLCALATRRGELAGASAAYLRWLREFLIHNGLKGSRVWEAFIYAELLERYSHPGLKARLVRKALHLTMPFRMLLRSATMFILLTQGRVSRLSLD